MNEPELYTLNAMARALRVPMRWLRAEALARRIPCLQAENRLLFQPATVIRILSERAAELPTRETVEVCQ